MLIIAHRRNTRALLAETPAEHGVEIDLRSHGSRLIVQHDPFKDGEDFTDWLTGYRHACIILNTKEEGLEAPLIGLMAQHGIRDYFFLDQSFPYLIKTAREGERRCAVRVSEFESIDTALALSGMIEWIWVDCFTRFPLDDRQARQLADAGFKLCLVSPELQGHTGPDEIPALRRLLAERGIRPAAVCTKHADAWR